MNTLRSRPKEDIYESTVQDDERLIAMWLHGKASNTQDAYFRDVLYFTGFVDKPLPMVGLRDLQEYADSLGRYRASTKARKLSSVKSLLAFGYRLGYLNVNVGTMIKVPRVKDALAERILDEEIVAELILSEPDQRNRLILDLLYKTGIRVSELCALKWRDAQARRNALQISIFGKGGHTRAILLPAALSRRLLDFKKDATPQDPIFGSAAGGALHRSQVYRIVRSAARRCGLDESVSPHWLRHAHASHALDHGAPAHLVQQTLGHASLATTGRYTHARPKDSSALYVPDKAFRNMPDR